MTKAGHHRIGQWPIAWGVVFFFGVEPVPGSAIIVRLRVLVSFHRPICVREERTFGLGQDKNLWAVKILAVSKIPISTVFGSRADDALKAARVPDLLEVAGPKVDDIVGDHKRYKEIDGPGRPLRQGVEFARAFILVMLVQAPQRLVQLSADFSAGVLVG